MAKRSNSIGPIFSSFSDQRQAMTEAHYLSFTAAAAILFATAPKVIPLVLFALAL